MIFITKNVIALTINMDTIAKSTRFIIYFPTVFSPIVSLLQLIAMPLSSHISLSFYHFTYVLYYLDIRVLL